MVLLELYERRKKELSCYSLQLLRGKMSERPLCI
jgi:hypothetical protein